MKEKIIKNFKIITEGKNPKAKNVISNATKNKKIIGYVIGILVIFFVEYVFLKNYVIVKNTYNYESGLLTFAKSLPFFTTNLFTPFNKGVGKEVFYLWRSGWLVNLLLFLVLYLSTFNRKSNFTGIEYGSARWGTEKEKQELKKTENSIPVAHELYISKSNPKLKNLNELVIGDTGAGKSFTKLIPDIMEMEGSFIITDVKGSLYRQTYKILRKRGFDKKNIKVLNFIDLRYSNTFNPFAYIESDMDIDRLANTFILNSRKDGASVGDSFWEDTSTMLLSSVISYLHYTDNENKSFFRIMDLVNSIELMNGEISKGCEYAKCIKQLKDKEPYHSAVLNYELVTKAPAETLQSVIVSLQSKLRLWVNEDLRIMTNSDEMDIDNICKEKTAIFLQIPAGDTTYKVVTSMFISTALSRLSYVANTVYKGKLPMQVSFELDEFANIGVLPNFDGAITTFRSQNIRALMIIQSLQQLKKNYDKADKTIISNCDTFNYLGTRDTETREQIVKMLGKTTINDKSFSKNVGGKQGGGSESDRGVGRELLTVDELGRIQNKSIVFIGTYFPFFCDKFQTQNHPLFKYLGNDDLDSDNAKNNVIIEEMYQGVYEHHKQEYNEYKSRAYEPKTQSQPLPPPFSCFDEDIQKQEIEQSEIEKEFEERQNQPTKVISNLKEKAKT